MWDFTGDVYNTIIRTTTPRRRRRRLDAEEDVKSATADS